MLLLKLLLKFYKHKNYQKYASGYIDIPRGNNNHNKIKLFIIKAYN